MLLADPKITTMVMGNHGVLVIGATVAETFNRLYYFERAAETYIRALQTGRPCESCPMPSPKRPLRNGRPIPALPRPICGEKAMLDAEDAGYARSGRRSFLPVGRSSLGSPAMTPDQGGKAHGASVSPRSFGAKPRSGRRRCRQGA
jgi:hypothetical protein